MTRAIQITAILALLVLLPNLCLAQDTKTTLKVVRPNRYVCCLVSISVYVNEKEVGSIANNETKSFEFTPAVGKNKLYLKMTDVLGFVSKSNEVEFECLAGATVNVNNNELSMGLISANLGVTVSVDKPMIAAVRPMPMLDTTTRLKSVELDDEVIDRPVFTETIEIVEGVTAKYRLERTYERSIQASVTAGVEAGGGAKVKAGVPLFGSATLSTEVKAKVESTLGITVGKRETFEQEITVNGDKTPNLKVIWVERYRRGTATLSDGRKEKFEVCVGLRWKLKKD